jgi:hypothetical protein
VTQNGTVTVAIARAGLEFSPASRQTAIFAKRVTVVEVTANGSADVPTTALTITLDQAVPGLSADDIILDSGNTTKSGALSGAGPVYTLPIDVKIGEMLNVSLLKNGYEFSPDKLTVTVFTNEPEYVYPVARELYLGVSTTSVHANPIAHAEASGRLRWYVNTWTGDAQQIGTSHANAPLRANLNSAQFLVIEYPAAPPAGRTLVLSLHAEGNWGHTYAQAMALPAEHRVVVTTDGVKKQFVFDLRSPFTKAAQTAASTFSTTATTYGLTINISSNMTGNAATRAYLANSRTP